ncbi:MAG: isoprenyl transferase [Flavobacteriales bacterium]|nr:MAG: isoprenyl transferase [Flavobacteriales bacterium]
MSDKNNNSLLRIPRHLAIIMDGNGRWAKKKGFIRSIGHKNGVDTLREITTACAELGVSYLTVYAFSTENWSRPQSEVKALMTLLVSSLKKELTTLMKNEIRLSAIGDISLLPAKCRRELLEVMDKTAQNGRMTLSLALSYSSRIEMVHCMKKIGQKLIEGQITISDIDESLIANNLFTFGMPDPDLLIRTGGEMRVSNYLLWQIAYCELYFSDKLWPEFTREDLENALIDYQNRERRFGKTSEQIAEENTL